MSSSNQKRLPLEWIVLILLVFAVVLIGLSSWTSNPSGVAVGPTLQQVQTTNRQEREQANVTVVVENLPEINPNETIFAVVLDTHSVNLDNVNFSLDVTLEKADKVIKPVRVKEEGSGHHRKAQIAFPKTSLPFTIIVSDVSGIPRREFTFQ